MSAASLQALPAPLRPTDDDWAKMLAAHVHLGTKNLDNKMVRSYVLSLFRGTPRMCSGTTRCSYGLGHADAKITVF
jgi:hypothetical protein